MKIKLAASAAKTTVETDDGVDFMDLMAQHGMYVSKISIKDIEAGEGPHVVFETFAIEHGGIVIEVPEEICTIKLVDERVTDD